MKIVTTNLQPSDDKVQADSGLDRALTYEAKKENEDESQEEVENARDHHKSDGFLQTNDGIQEENTKTDQFHSFGLCTSWQSQKAAGRITRERIQHGVRHR